MVWGERHTASLTVHPLLRPARKISLPTSNTRAIWHQRWMEDESGMLEESSSRSFCVLHKTFPRLCCGVEISLLVSQPADENAEPDWKAGEGKEEKGKLDFIMPSLRDGLRNEMSANTRDKHKYQCEKALTGWPGWTLSGGANTHSLNARLRVSMRRE